MISLSSTISAGKLSPNVILKDISDSSHIAQRFLEATETRQRVKSSLMMKTVILLTDAVKAHRQMRSHITTSVVDAGTSWTTGLSRFFASLDNMVQGHIADSQALLGVLNDVYLNHVDYMVTQTTTHLQHCNSLVAEGYRIAVKSQTTYTWALEDNRMRILPDNITYLSLLTKNFVPNLNAEARVSPHRWHYFPNPLLIGNCSIISRKLEESLTWYLKWIEPFIPKIEEGDREAIRDDIFAGMRSIRSYMTSLSDCLLSYKRELDDFAHKLRHSISAVQTDFTYETPTASLLRFNKDNAWLESIARRYIASSLTKLQVAEYFHANGSELLNNADQLYTDIEISLFSKVGEIIYDKEKALTSFYKDLLLQLNSLQRYMFSNDTSLEKFMRRLSIWRTPIVNFQKSQVYCYFCCCIV